MTRAEKWLIVAAAGDLGKEGSWYHMADEALRHLNAVPFNEGPAHGLRHEEAGWDALPVVEVPAKIDKKAELEPVFESMPPPAPIRPDVLSPSDLEGAKALPGEAGVDEDAAKTYGTLVHMLLEHLAGLAPSDRKVAAEQLLRTADPATAKTALEETLATLDAPNLAPIFAPSALTEVAVTAKLGTTRLYGIIDRLIVEEDRVLAVDFKTNRTVPDTPNACPEGLLRQMGAYSHALVQIYPNHRIETAILWTHTGVLMTLPHDTVTAALQRTGHLDAATASS